MSDRFKFRVYFKGSEYAKSGYEDLNREDVIYSLRPDGQVIRTVIYECQQEGHEGSPCPMQFTPNNDLYDIQFCTGLKDKNGKLIYEGDVLKDKYGALHPISWNVKGFYEADTFAVAGFYNAIQEDMEVIGNIYENPELLKEYKDE